MDRGHIRHHSEQFSNIPPPMQHSPTSFRPQYSPIKPGQAQSRSTFGDPFAQGHDPFSIKQNGSKEDGGRSRAWSIHSQAHRPLSPPFRHDKYNIAHTPQPTHQYTPAFAPPNFLVPPAPATTNAVSNHMSAQHDPLRKRSISAASPMQFAGGMFISRDQVSNTDGKGQLDSIAGAVYGQRAMPPPSPHQAPPATFNPPQHHPEPHGPPTASPFSGIRDLANLSSTRRPGAGMSISSILGNDERPASNRAASPHSVLSHPTHSSRDLMQPPSPGRARASSMRESGYTGRSYRQTSPHIMSAVEPRSATQRDGFGTFLAGTMQRSASSNGNGLPNRPSSQPVDTTPTTLHKEGSHLSDGPAVGKLGMFRTFDEPRHEQIGGHVAIPRGSPRQNGAEPRRFSPTQAAAPVYGPPMREDQAALFRPAYPVQQSDSLASIEANGSQDYRRATPPPFPASFRNGHHERPFTFEEHQRLESLAMQRKDSSGSVTRSIFNISPELNRRGRDSPLPQAVQGAAPRHVGPGGDHPGIKSEFGRMFSGLGSFVGSATPVAGQSMNGNTTPSRLTSPPRFGDEEYDERSASVGGMKRGARRSRDMMMEGGEVYDGRMTPSLSQRGMKRSKTTHPPHHHHHHHHHAHRHHHESAEPHTLGSYGMIRFPSNPVPQSTQPSHKHFHYHNHVHSPHHHHHHGPRPTPALRVPTITINSQEVIDVVASKPRRHLGSMPYNADVSIPVAKLASDHRRYYSTISDVMPKFEDKENCLFTIRVPRWYINQSPKDIAAGEVSRLEETCRSRRVWGSEIYSDDSDIIAAAVHAGWIRGDYGDANDDLLAFDGPDEKTDQELELRLNEKPSRPARIPPAKDMHITVVILPPLQSYGSTHQHHMTSREWSKATHDGMSFMIEQIEFVNEGCDDRGIGRDAKSRKARMAVEEAEKRHAAAAALLMLPGLGKMHGVQVGA